MLLIGGVVSSESDESLVDLFAGKWRDVRSVGSALFLSSARVTNVVVYCPEDRIYDLRFHRYVTMIYQFFLPALQKKDLENVWLQQDGTTVHTSTLGGYSPPCGVLRAYFPE
ncbi:hypothetical protein TNCV_3788871 [Trichonephila clavipes]|nr:hypothetical protein TNCV_3788871 [Trichonephila clavipes]